MLEPRDVKIKRLRMRSMRRGTKEMDLILMGFADAHLAQMSDDGLTLYDALLEENDQDLYRWVSGQEPGPEQFSELLSRISKGAEGIVRPD